MLNIIPIPAFKDNYIWALHDRQHAVVVDPGDAAPVRAWLDAQQLKLAAILCTHHHNDHVGGICELAQLYNAPVYGPRHENIPCISHAIGEDDEVKIAELSIQLKVLDIPGHTIGHIAYLAEGAVFCGDTLFSCGCGRLFEGTAEPTTPLAATPGTTAGRYAGLLRARIHRGQHPLRLGLRTGQCPTKTAPSGCTNIACCREIHPALHHCAGKSHQSISTLHRT